MTRSWSGWLAVAVVSSGCLSPTVSLGDDWARAPLEASGTTEDGGVWQAPAASEQWPCDGSLDRLIAFDSNRAGGNRDLWALRMSDCYVKRLTDEPSSEQQPAFSPDGTRLAFASDRVRQTMQVFVMDLATKATTQVTSGPLAADQPAWSPDGTHLAFHRDIGVSEIAVDGTGERKIIDGLDALNDYRNPTYSPDGLWLIADKFSQVDAIRLDDPAFLRHILPNNTTGGSAPSVSPDGWNLAYQVYCYDSLGRSGMTSIWTAPISGIAHGCTGTRLSPEETEDSRNPAWGPGLILYERGKGSGDILGVAPNGGPPRYVTFGPADDRNPAWAPVGTMVP